MPQDINLGSLKGRIVIEGIEARRTLKEFKDEFRHVRAEATKVEKLRISIDAPTAEIRGVNRLLADLDERLRSVGTSMEKLKLRGARDIAAYSPSSLSRLTGMGEAEAERYVARARAHVAAGETRASGPGPEYGGAALLQVMDPGRAVAAERVRVEQDAAAARAQEEYAARQQAILGPYAGRLARHRALEMGAELLPGRLRKQALSHLERRRPTLPDDADQEMADEMAGRTLKKMARNTAIVSAIVMGVVGVLHLSKSLLSGSTAVAGVQEAMNDIIGAAKDKAFAPALRELVESTIKPAAQGVKKMPFGVGGMGSEALVKLGLYDDSLKMDAIAAGNIGALFAVEAAQNLGSTLAALGGVAATAYVGFQGVTKGIELLTKNTSKAADDIAKSGASLGDEAAKAAPKAASLGDDALKAASKVTTGADDVMRGLRTLGKGAGVAGVALGAAFGVKEGLDTASGVPAPEKSLAEQRLDMIGGTSAAAAVTYGVSTGNAGKAIDYFVSGTPNPYAMQYSNGSMLLPPHVRFAEQSQGSTAVIADESLTRLTDSWAMRLGVVFEDALTKTFGAQGGYADPYRSSGSNTSGGGGGSSARFQ